MRRQIITGEDSAQLYTGAVSIALCEASAGLPDGTPAMSALSAHNRDCGPCADCIGYPTKERGVTMACPHFKITIRQRSHRKSAVAGAAYISCSKLFSEYDGLTKNYESKQKELVVSEILLPAHAPPEYADRQTLWNAVEKVENQWNAQLSIDLIIALPRELPRDEQIQLAREYCKSQFVAKGMIADYAIHDKGDGNPHLHIMLTMRAMDEHGKWLPKARKVYDLDENGQRIVLPSGNYASHKENLTDWDRRRNCEVWRTAWTDLVNQYYIRNGIEEQLDLRSYERQGVSDIPTVHLGPEASAMERNGVQTELGEYNRQVTKHNSFIKTLRQRLAELYASLKEVLAEAKSATAETAEKAMQPTVMDYLHEFVSMQKEGRIEWKNPRVKEKASVNDVKFFAQAFAFCQKHNIRTLDDMDTLMADKHAQFDRIAACRTTIRKNNLSMKRIKAVKELQPIFDQSKRGFKLVREKYAAAHQAELETYRKAYRYLKANDLSVDDMDKLKAENAALEKEAQLLEEKLRAAGFEFDLVEEILWRVDQAVKAGRMPEHITSIADSLKSNNHEEKEKKEIPKDKIIR